MPLVRDVDHVRAILRLLVARHDRGFEQAALGRGTVAIDAGVAGPGGALASALGPAALLAGLRGRRARVGLSCRGVRAPDGLALDARRVQPFVAVGAADEEEVGVRGLLADAVGLDVLDHRNCQSKFACLGVCPWMVVDLYDGLTDS